MSNLAFLYPELQAAVAEPPASGADEPERRRRRYLEAALLAQPVRTTPMFRPYAGSGFRRAVQARSGGRDTAA